MEYNNNNDAEYVKWTMDSMLEITIPEPDSFLKIKETLTRIGVASKKDDTLFQSCHILHKQGRYFLVHFKELFALDGKETNISINDIGRRNTIAILLQDWNLLHVVDTEKASNKTSLTSIKILSYAEKSKWKLVQKYAIGVRKK